MGKQRPLVGIIIGEPDFDFYKKALMRIRQDFYDANIDTAVFATLLTPNDQQDIENSIFSLLKYGIADALIIFTHTLAGEDIKSQLKQLTDELKVPVLCIDEQVGEHDCICFDNDSCTLQMAKHLKEHHNVTDVALVSGPAESFFHERVKESFVRSFAKLGIAVPENRIYYGLDWVGDFSIIADDIISDGLPEAVVCCGDFTANALIGEFARRGIYVPDDLIITGYAWNEPFAGSHFNITSIERDPETIAARAAGYIIEKLTGQAYEHKECLSGRFVPGISCGCERLDLAAMADSALETMLQSRRSGFDSYYNYMQEDLIGAEYFEDYLWKVDWYTCWLEGISGFRMCINDGVMHVSGNFSGYTHKMFMPLERIGDQGDVDLERSYSLSEVLPALTQKREHPCTFLFTGLHFNQINFGFAVLTYEDNHSFIDQTYVKWLRYTAGALEKQRKSMIHNDAVSDTQVRDPLTGLLNMKGFKRTMTERSGRFDRPDKLLRIISVDIENLRGINDGYGYDEGDKVLQRLAVILNNSAGEDDICVRVSGDEFLIAGILDAGFPVDEVPSSLERNLAAFNSGKADYGIHIYTSRVTAPLTSPDILDTLPYEANYQKNLTKDNRNKNRKTVTRTAKTEPFDPQERKYVAKMLNDNLFTYHFQPIVSAKSGEIFAYEALMRSAGEVKLSPIAILNHASAMGRLDDIERHTMQNLFRFYHENKMEFNGRRLFINSIPSCIISDKEFDELCTQYNDIIDKLVIEFTEQTEASSEQLELVLGRRNRKGFEIAIDDYGTGYSNISNLLTFMPNCVKIDRSLIMNIHQDKRKQHFTKNIIDYAHDNNFQVLAEGVEEIEELKTVISMGVDLIQGYLTARPAPEIIKNIEWDIAEKIREYNRLNENRQARKTYFTGSEPEISLMSLDFDDYTDIFVGTESFTLKGTKDHVSDICIYIKDGISARLDLYDVSMAGELNEACIVLGKGSKLVLGIHGQVNLAGAVRVPETADLRIEGEGELTLRSSSNQTYGIGADGENSYGNITIDLDNKMYIHLDSEKCIGIGGGYNKLGSKIEIRCKEMGIELSGKKVLCIGCAKSDAAVTLRDTRLTMINRCSRGVGIGSFERSMDVNIQHCEITADASGDEIAGICVYTDKGSSVNIVESNIHMLFKGKDIIGVGSQQGDITVILVQTHVDIRCEGATALGMGGHTDNCKVAFYSSKGSVAVVSSSATCVGAGIDGPIMQDSDVKMLDNE